MKGKTILDYEDIANKILDLLKDRHPDVVTPRRTRGIKSFLANMVKYYYTINNMPYTARKEISKKYKYFFSRTKKGMIPIPTRLMQNWDNTQSRYRIKLVKTLEEEGFLKIAMTHYYRPGKVDNKGGAVENRCRHFNIILPKEFDIAS